MMEVPHIFSHKTHLQKQFPFLNKILSNYLTVNARSTVIIAEYRRILIGTPVNAFSYKITTRQFPLYEVIMQVGCSVM